ncbi:MAG TPA: hypothetical protein VE980_20480 [Pyrinomonadaceae bacterium]|nr:hypothetical protein [Pyrinomonadaceae bacterium]
MSLLQLVPVTFTDRLLEIKVKNTTGAVLDKRLVIEISPPAHLVDEKIIEAAREAAVSEDPPGAASLAGIVTGPAGWSVWVRREPSDSSLIIVFINDMGQDGKDLEKPIAFAAGAEPLLRIPLDPDADRVAIEVLFDYQHGKNESDPHFKGNLPLTSEPSVWRPDVTLTTDETSRTAVAAGTKVKVYWHVGDGVSATLRGPLPGGNTELFLSTDPNADFKIADGVVEVRVMSATTYVLQAVVRRPGKPNVVVVRMLSFDTLNQKYTYLHTQRNRVLLNGLIEIDWAAWGVKQVLLTVSNHTTRFVKLTQQTVGRFYEGSGVMRVTATKRETETIDIEGLDFEGTVQQKSVTVVTWQNMTKPALTGQPLGMSVIAPKLMVLTNEGLFIAEVGEIDPTTSATGLTFTTITTPVQAQWLALTAVLSRFVALRRTPENDLEVAPYTKTGAADEIPPLNLPADLRPFVGREGAVFDLIGYAGRAYVVVEAALPGGPVRRVFSVGFDATAKKAEYRREPLLESLPGYKLLTFDNALYALHRNSGRMLRFERSATGTLEPLLAASAITKSGGAAESMIRKGLIVPVGRLLVVLSPNAIPSLKEVEPFGLRNVLPYTTTPLLRTDNAPQDIFYNPQKNYWGRCGHDLEVTPGAVAAFRGGGSPRLWVTQSDKETATLAVGSENLFAHDYWPKVPTKKLPEYLNKKRRFTITNRSAFRLLPMGVKYANAGLPDFSAESPAELTAAPPNPIRFVSTESFELRYNEADPAPVHMRFLTEQVLGVKHDYMLDITLSGPDLSKATSVFKRIAVDDSGSVSIADIPGTTVEHSTNQPIVIPLAQPLIDEVKLRINNLTSYQLLYQVRGLGDPSRYNGRDIGINAHTPPFSILAYATGELQFELDYSLPAGIELSSGAEPQRKRIRINTARRGALQVELLTTSEPNTYELKINYRLVRELPGVYISDAVATNNGAAIYLPVALPEHQGQIQVWHIDIESLAVAQRSANFSSAGNGVFSLPNTITLTDDFILAMFSNNLIQVLDYGLQVQGQVSLNNFYTVVTGIEYFGDKNYFVLGMKQDRPDAPDSHSHYVLWLKQIARARNPTPTNKISTMDIYNVILNSVAGFREQNRVPGSPAWVSSLTVSPMAVSTSPVSPRNGNVKEVAICIDGGLFLVSGSLERNILSLKLDSVGREEDIVFGKEGKTIYCLHSRTDNQGLRVSRVDNQTFKQTGSVSLPPGEGVADLTKYTRPKEAGKLYKNHRSASLVCMPDEKYLFVSHGKSIFRIDAATMTLRDTYTMELPCRVFHAWTGKPDTGRHPVYGAPDSCILVYAIGSSYKGDGKWESEFKTQIYKIGILDK